MCLKIDSFAIFYEIARHKMVTAIQKVIHTGGNLKSRGSAIPSAELGSSKRRDDKAKNFIADMSAVSQIL